MFSYKLDKKRNSFRFRSISVWRSKSFCDNAECQLIKQCGHYGNWFKYIFFILECDWCQESCNEVRFPVWQSVPALCQPGEGVWRDLTTSPERLGRLQCLHLRLRADWLRKNIHHGGQYPRWYEKGHDTSGHGAGISHCPRTAGQGMAGKNQPQFVGMRCRWNVVGSTRNFLVICRTIYVQYSIENDKRKRAFRGRFFLFSFLGVAGGGGRTFEK